MSMTLGTCYPPTTMVFSVTGAQPVAQTTAPTAPTTSAGILVLAVLSGAFLAALITAAVNIWLARRKSREEERSRLRSSFAEAFATYAAYKEFPYAIRRRRADSPAEERVRLSEALRDIQANIAYHQNWTILESETVGQEYEHLIEQVRRIAGAAMRESWNSAPIDSDGAMNIPAAVVDLSELAAIEDRYIRAVRAHLRGLAPWWAR